MNARRWLEPSESLLSYIHTAGTRGPNPIFLTAYVAQTSRDLTFLGNRFALFK